VIKKPRLEDSDMRTIMVVVGKKIIVLDDEKEGM
jgi:hypothetical protein